MSATLTNWPADYRRAVVGQRAGARQGRDLDAGERIRRLVGGVAKPEVGRGERVGVSSLAVMVLSVPAGASFTGLTVIATSSLSVAPAASCTDSVSVSLPS